MHNNHSSYSRWTWIIALLLALALLVMLLTGKGIGSSSCCHEQVAEQAPPAISEVPIPTEDPTIVGTFSFSASESAFTSNGIATEISWIDDIDALKALLSGGLLVDGGDTWVVLSGTVNSEEEKKQKEVDAQAFFGPDVRIDNLISVVAEEPEDVPPATAKIYFDVGFHRLPADGPSILEPVITWLKNHTDAKAIISGYHDPTGDLISNQLLAKKRAQSTYDALIAGGVNANNIEMRKPTSTEGDGDLSEARRVEVSIE